MGEAARQRRGEVARKVGVVNSIKQRIPARQDANRLLRRALHAYFSDKGQRGWPEPARSGFSVDVRSHLFVVLRSSTGKVLAVYRVRHDGKLMTGKPYGKLTNKVSGRDLGY